MAPGQFHAHPPFPFTLWIGIDQTGAAVDGGRRARSLPVVLASSAEAGDVNFWIRCREGKGLRLPSLLPESLSALLESTVGRRGLSPDIALLIDCVLGLPANSRDLWSWFEEAARVLQPAYGRARAEAFFAEVLAEIQLRESATRGGLPRRRVEGLVGANSVFASRPFQKNIQTGTYRFWRELGLGARANGGQPWLGLWPFDGPGRRALAIEGFPSWMWRQAFGCPTRDLEALPDAFAEAFKKAGLRARFRAQGEDEVLRDSEAWTLLKADADLSDALALAAGGILLHRQGALLDPRVRDGAPPGEGWIAGVPFPEDAGDEVRSVLR